MTSGHHCGRVHLNNGDDVMDQSEKYPRPSETPEPQPENGQVDKEEPEPALKLSKPRFLLVLLGLVVSIFLVGAINCALPGGEWRLKY